MYANEHGVRERDSLEDFQSIKLVVLTPTAVQ